MGHTDTLAVSHLWDQHLMIANVYAAELTIVIVIILYV